MSSRAKKQRRKQRIANQVLEDKTKKAQLIVFDEVSPIKYERAAEIIELLKGTEPFLLEPGESFRCSGKRGGGLSNYRTPEENETMRGILDRRTSKMNPHRMDPIDMKKRVVVAGSCGGGMSQLRGLLKRILDEGIALDPMAGTSTLVPSKTYHRFELVDPEPRLPNQDWSLQAIDAATQRKSELLEARLCGDWKRPEPPELLTADKIFEAIEKMKNPSKPSLHTRLIELIIHAQRCLHGGFLEYGFITIEEIERQIREITDKMDFTERDNACVHALKLISEKELRKIIWKIREETREEQWKAKLEKEPDHGPDNDV